jgi:hypothetical protein
VEITIPQPRHCPAFATLALHYLQEWMHSVAFRHTPVTVCPVLFVEYACVIIVLRLYIFIFLFLDLHALQYGRLHIACVYILYGYLVTCNTLNCPKKNVDIECLKIH